MNKMWFAVIIFVFLVLPLSHAQTLCNLYAYHNAMLDSNGNVIGDNVTQLGNCTGNAVSSEVYVRMPNGYGASASNTGTTIAEAVATTSTSADTGQGSVSGSNSVSFKCYEPVVATFQEPFTVSLASTKEVWIGGQLLGVCAVTSNCTNPPPRCSLSGIFVGQNGTCSPAWKATFGVFHFAGGVVVCGNIASIPTQDTSAEVCTPQ